MDKDTTVWEVLKNADFLNGSYRHEVLMNDNAIKEEIRKKLTFTLDC